VGFTLGLAGVGLLPSIHENAVLQSSFLGATLVLLAWNAWLWATAGTTRQFAFDVVLRKQHYLQACAQASVYVYWGWYWRQVYDSVPLILAQLLFAYAFDMLLAWSRRDTYTLGFGPFPIIFSTNLFLWFKPDWFYLQFLMVAVGFAAKEFIRWEKDGRRVHIFNPSSFSLGLFSLLLILTGSTGITWGQEIATTFERPPYIRPWIFLIGLPGQFLFGVTTMTMSAVLTVCAFGFGYFLTFGTYFFVDAYIPAAVFLGMHLLFTDPSTAPRTELGRIIFGIMYGLAVVTLFSLLGHLGVPTFYDKLMAVPIMNLLIQAIDRAARSRVLRPLDPAALGRALTSRQRNLAYMSVWALAFVVVSDPFAWHRPRRWVPFWQQACQDGRRGGCDTLGKIETQYCSQGSSWACNELGILVAEGRFPPRMSAAAAFQHACGLGLSAGCDNAGLPSTSLPEAFRRLAPSLSDYPILLQEGNGLPPDQTPDQTYDRACKQGWTDGCSQLARRHEGGR
jgi:hypothetical protein